MIFLETFSADSIFAKLFSVLLAPVKLSSDANFTFYCLGCFCFETILNHFDRYNCSNILNFST